VLIVVQVKTALFRDLEKWKSTVEGLATKLSRVMSIQHSQRHQVKYLDIVDLVNILPCYLIADNMVCAQNPPSLDHLLDNVLRSVFL
jgi:hypothetical protein